MAQKIYKIDFVGRTNGAIGIRYAITETVSAENQDDAILKLYEKYEHISIKRIEEEK